MKDSNILIVTNYFAPEMGAAPNRMFLLCNNLSMRGYKPIVICPIPNYPKSKVYDGYKNKIILKEQIKKLSLIRPLIYSSNSSNKLKRVISMFSFALWLVLLIPYCVIVYSPKKIIIQSPPLVVGFVGVLLGRLFRREVILNVSDLWPKTALELGFFNKGLLYWLLLIIEKNMYTLSNKILCQSEEIILHIRCLAKKSKLFLYRNLTKENVEHLEIEQTEVRLIYAGLLGHAQGMYKIVQKVNFSKLNIYLDIYGDGYERDSIVNFIKDKTHINYKGVIKREQLLHQYKYYNLALVPLSTPIYGAVPSKIYELINNHIPIIYCGSGEAAKIILDNNVGSVIGSEDFETMEQVLLDIRSNLEILKEFKKNTIFSSTIIFNFDTQFDNFLKFIK